MTSLPDRLSTATARLDAIPRTGEVVRGLSGAELHDSLTRIGDARRALDSIAAVLTGEVARRSAPELGVKGFAAQAGHRRVEDFIAATTLVRGTEAVAMVRVAKLTQEPDSTIGTAVAAGSVSVAAADAIRGGLGEPNQHITREELDQAAAVLCEDAGTTPPDVLREQARRLRDEIDEDGIADREAALRRRRSLKRIRLGDGMVRYLWDADPETAAVIDQIYDRATSPRRGGPRFVDPEQAQKAKSIEDDDRTTEQLASDAFVELLRQAATVDETVLLRGQTPTVKVLVVAESLATGTGHGTLENGEAVSIETVKRLACANGIQQLILDPSGQVLDLGHEIRLFTSRQKQALAVRDGGCPWADCERPPSWCEAHHIDEVVRHQGKTNLADGVLLCRYHHLRLHNERRRIIRRHGTYHLGPPGSSLVHPPVSTGSTTGLPPGPGWVLLETKSRAVKELLTPTG